MPPKATIKTLQIFIATLTNGKRSTANSITNPITLLIINQTRPLPKKTTKRITNAKKTNASTGPRIISSTITDK